MHFSVKPNIFRTNAHKQRFLMNQLQFCLSTKHETVPVWEHFHQACISSVSISSVGINLTKYFFITQVIRTEKKFCKCSPLCSLTWIKTPVVTKSTPGIQKYFLMNYLLWQHGVWNSIYSAISLIYVYLVSILSLVSIFHRYLSCTVNHFSLSPIVLWEAK